MQSQTFEEAKKYGIKDEDFIGFFCIPCYFDHRPKVIQDYRVAHLVKVHHFPKSSLPTESNFEIQDPIEASKFDILLRNDTVRCPHCNNLLMKQFHVGNPDFTLFVCLDKECIKKWEKIHGGGYFQTAELIAPKKKYYCFEHTYNSDEEPCRYCKQSKEMSNIVGEMLSTLSELS